MSGSRRRLWLPLAPLVALEIAYPLASADARARLTIAIVAYGFTLSVGHALLTQGPRVAGSLVAITAGGGFLVEVVGVTTGFPFGDYRYGTALGPTLSAVPVVIALAWTWMAWPAWLAAGRLTPRPYPRIVLAGLALASWDLFLDPQMVAEGYWQWTDEPPISLPGVASVPISNYLGWLAVATLMMTALAAASATTTRVKTATSDADATMLALYLWTYGSSVLAHAVFLGLPASAGWGAVGMGLIAVPVGFRLVRS